MAADTVAGSVAQTRFGPRWSRAKPSMNSSVCSTVGRSNANDTQVAPASPPTQLPLTLLTLNDTVTSVRTQELFLYDEYPVAFMMHEVFGFGKPLDHQPIMAMPGVQSGTWAGPVMMVADAVGVDARRASGRPTRSLPTPRASRWQAG